MSVPFDLAPKYEWTGEDEHNNGRAWHSSKIYPIHSLHLSMPSQELVSIGMQLNKQA